MFHYVTIDENRIVTSVFTSSTELDIQTFAEIGITIIPIEENQYKLGDYVE
jgi:hypothetical protein